jgi:hypothetical protein
MVIALPFTFYFTDPLAETQDTSVGIAIGYGLPTDLFSSTYRPDRLWGPFRILSNGSRGLFPHRESNSGSAIAHLYPPTRLRLLKHNPIPSYVVMERCLIRNMENLTCIGPSNMAHYFIRSKTATCCWSWHTVHTAGTARHVACMGSSKMHTEFWWGDVTGKTFNSAGGYYRKGSPGCRDWMNLMQDRWLYRALVNTVMNLWVS